MWWFKSGGFCKKIDEEEVFEDEIEDEIEDDSVDTSNDLTGFITSIKPDEACFVYIILHDLGSRVMLYDIIRRNITMATRNTIMPHTLTKAPQDLINQVALYAENHVCNGEYVYFSHLVTDEAKKIYS